MAYLINLLIIPVYYIIIASAITNTEKRNKLFAIIVCVHATLFRALANPYNYVDTDLYDEGFVTISGMTFQEAILSINYYTHWGQGYLLFNWLLGRITSDSTFLFVTSSILAVLPVIWFYYKASFRLLLPTLLYLSYPMMYFMGFGVLREHLAVPFVLLALYYIDKLRISIPLAITAFFFHTSAIIFIPFFFWRKINFSSKNRGKIVIFIFIIVLVMRLAMGYVLSFMPKYEEITQSTESQNNFIPVILFGLISLYISAIDFRKKGKLFGNIQSFTYYGLAVSLFSIGIPGLGRLTIYFLYVMPVAVSLYLFFCKDLVKKSFLLLCILLIYARQIYYFLEVKSMAYDFFWEQASAPTNLPL